jgi:hypothetical protein
MRTLRNVLLPLILVMSSGCCATMDLIRTDYTAADRATYDAIAPAYGAYVAADATLDKDEKKTRERTLTTWRMRLENAEKPVLPAEGEGE